ncbi:MAG: low molecular weight protein-tyrosine-phosphatase [Solirubrobacterales bacterium]
MADPIRLCFVCLGNICRSPTAEGVMRALVAERGVTDRVQIDSAGTGGWHVGHPPDERATDAAAQRGIELAGGARRFTADDFERFDLVLAADRANHRDLVAMAPDREAAAKVRLLRSYDPDAPDDAEVPDPYYGGERGFEVVLDQVQAACEGLLDELLADPDRP